MKNLSVILSILLFIGIFSCREIPTFEANPVDPISSEFQVAPPTSVNVLVIDARKFGGSLDYRLIWSVPIIEPYGVFNGVELQRFNFETNQYQETDRIHQQTYSYQFKNIQNQYEQFRVRTFFADAKVDTVFSEWVESDVITKTDTKIELLTISFLNSSNAKLFVEVTDLTNNNVASTIDLEKKVNNGNYTLVDQLDVETEFYWDDVELSIGDNITYRARISSDSNINEFVYSEAWELNFDLGAPHYGNVYSGMDSIYVYFDETISADGYRIVLTDKNESIIQNRTVLFDRNKQFYTAFGDLDNAAAPFSVDLFIRLDGQESERVEYFSNIYLDQ